MVYLLYSVRMQENTDPKKLRIWTLFTQWNLFTSKIGLKQDCDLSPILFNTFINDINDIFDKRLCQPLKIHQLTLNNVLYADDLALLSEKSFGLWNSLHKLQQYCHKWKLTVNTKRTKTVITAKRQLAMASFFTFNGNVIETFKSYPYLRSLIYNNHQFRLTISELCKSASRAMCTLLGYLNRFSSRNVTILLDLFDKKILPVCTYNCEVVVRLVHYCTKIPNWNRLLRKPKSKRQNMSIALWGYWKWTPLPHRM